MQPGLVSIMMPAHNAAGYIGEAIASVLAQSYERWELLIVNDGSTDATAAIAGGFQDQRIRLFNKANGGESSARNVALEHARGEYIAYLDADDAYFPNHLAATIRFLNANPHCDAVYTDGFHIDEDGVRLVSLQRRRRGPFAGRIYKQLVRASDVFGPPICVVLRHALVAKHALRYDPRIVIGPDWEFFIRYSDLATFGYLAECTCLYRVHGSNITSKVNPTRRAASLSLCREKAIKMPSFAGCSTETQVAAFYNLLVNHLCGQPERQSGASTWPEFERLPRAEQARLLRVMARYTLRSGRADVAVGEWLERACQLNPADRRSRLLATLFRISPRFAGLVLRLPDALQGRKNDAPFADLAEHMRRGRIGVQGT